MEQTAKMQRPVWDYLFYLSMLIVLLWIFLKSVGIIKTPFWLEYGLPIASFVIGVLMLFHSISDKMADLRASDARMEAGLAHLENDVERVKDDIISMKSALRA